MKEYLVDVPVKLILWSRPELTRRVWEVLKEARPSILFIISDGGRNPEEKALIEESRKVVEEIDWECTVYKQYFEDNQGMYSMMRLSGEFIFSKVDRCIFLEDDNIPSVSYFQFCAEMLEKYKDDLRIGAINGFNVLGEYEECSSDYFFSREGSIYGFATWKRAYLPLLESDLDFTHDEYIYNLVRKNAKDYPVFRGGMKKYKEGKTYAGHAPGEEFYQTASVFTQNQLYLIPKKNLISNVGCSDGGAHTRDLKKMAHGWHRIYEVKRYECEFPLIHPKYIVPDTYFEKKRNYIYAAGHPIILFCRRCESAMRMILFGDVKDVIKRVSSMFRNSEG